MKLMAHYLNRGAIARGLLFIATSCWSLPTLRCEELAPPLAVGGGAEQDPDNATLQEIETHDTLLRGDELKRHELLQATVSLRVKSTALMDVMADLAKQSDVNLTVEPQIVARNLKMTARIQAVPVGEIMDSITRLYGGVWEKLGPKDFTLTDDNQTTLDLGVLRLGSWYHYGPARSSYQKIVAEREARQELSRSIMQVVDEAAVRSKEGVALTSLPLNLQQRIRQDRVEERALDLVRDVVGAKRFSEALANALLRVESYGLDTRLGKPDAAGKQLPNIAYRVSVLSAERSLATLNFLLPPPGFTPPKGLAEKLKDDQALQK